MQLFNTQFNLEKSANGTSNFAGLYDEAFKQMPKFTCSEVLDIKEILQTPVFRQILDCQAYYFLIVFICYLWATNLKFDSQFASILDTWFSDI